MVSVLSKILKEMALQEAARAKGEGRSQLQNTANMINSGLWDALDNAFEDGIERGTQLGDLLGASIAVFTLCLSIYSLLPAKPGTEREVTDLLVKMFKQRIGASLKTVEKMRAEGKLNFKDAPHGKAKEDDSHPTGADIPGLGSRPGRPAKPKGDSPFLVQPVKMDSSDTMADVIKKMAAGLKDAGADDADSAARTTGLCGTLMTRITPLVTEWLNESANVDGVETREIADAFISCLANLTVYVLLEISNSPMKAAKSIVEQFTEVTLEAMDANLALRDKEGKKEH